MINKMVLIQKFILNLLVRFQHQQNDNSKCGRLAQLVERTLSMREVGGSKPSLSKNLADWRNG